MKMKKTAIVLAVLTASLFAVSCQKENNPEATGFAPMTINAVSEGIGATTKVEMAYKYDLLWQNNDEILVKNTTKSAVFALNGGAGTTKGTFSCSASPFMEGDAVEAFYPQSIVDGNNLVWPATLTNNQTVPMYSTKTLSATEEETFNFSSLGSVFQLIFSTESKDVVLQSIELKADEAMSGVFTINNGKAVMPTEGDKPGIKLDLGETGVALGVAAKKFNIAIPAGEYNNLTIILTAKDGRECEIKAKNAQTIEYNTVSTLTLSKEFKFQTPDGALPGLFSIGDNMQVRFSKGNLYCKRSGSEGSYSYSFAFEDKQWKFHTRYNKPLDYYTVEDLEVDVTDLAKVPGLINEYDASGLFQWLLFADGTPEDYGAFSELSYEQCYGSENGVVEFGNAMGANWSTLNDDEWAYLVGYDRASDKHGDDYGRKNATMLYREGITVNGVLGLILAPDGWYTNVDNPSIIGEGSLTAYDETTTPKWSEMESKGLVFLPYAGSYSPTRNAVGDVAHIGHYWSNSFRQGDNGSAWEFISYVDWGDSYVTDSPRGSGCPVRLVYR